MLGIHGYLSRQVSPYSCISISFEHLHLYFSDPIYEHLMVPSGLLYMCVSLSKGYSASRDLLGLLEASGFRVQ